MYEDWNHTKYVLWSQWNEIGTQNRKKYTKYTNMWNLNNITKWPLGWRNKPREIREYVEINENKNTTYQN